MAKDHPIRRPHFLSREAADRCQAVLRLSDSPEPDVREIASETLALLGNRSEEDAD